MVWWPLLGLVRFLGRPLLWLVPALAGTATLCGLILLGLAVLHHAWPPAGLGLWSWSWQLLEALGLALSAMLAGWMVVVPLVMGLAMERVARRVQREPQPQPAGESVWSGLASSLHLLRRTWLLRLVFASAALLGSCLGPLGVIIGT